MVPEKLIQDFVQRFDQAAGENRVAVILYGSALGEDFDAALSDINLMCVLRRSSLADLGALSSAIEWWAGKKQRPPLIVTKEELTRSADVFAIEFLDIKRRHRVLSGDDLLTSLEIPMQLHRAQVEYELREKLILLRQRLMLSLPREDAVWNLMLQSLPAFTTLFRHALIAFGDDARHSAREALALLARRLGFDPAPVMELLDVREHKKERKGVKGIELCSRYLDAIQQVTEGVDKLLDSIPART